MGGVPSNITGTPGAAPTPEEFARAVQRQAGEGQASRDDALEFEHNSKVTLQAFEATIASGQSALKTGVLINGGAAVALLAFLGSTSSRTGSATPLVHLRLLSVALLCFGAGVLASAFAAGFVYLAQLKNLEYVDAAVRSFQAKHLERKRANLSRRAEGNRRAANSRNRVATIFVVSALACFIAGLGWSFSVFWKMR